MSEEKINKLNTKLEVMENKVQNLVYQNTKEHEAIFSKLDEIQKTLDAQDKATALRIKSYYECFATKKELDETNAMVKTLSQFYWKIIGILGFILFLVSIFRDNLLKLIR